MSFSQRVVTLRKQRGLTQQGLSDATGIHVQQIKRYESGSSLPTAEEREPKDDMKLRFEALAAMSATDQAVVKAVIDAIMVKSQVTQAVTEVSKNTRHGVKKDK
ncbi:helix-turn-helix domain-containing protein [Arsenophonus nasoniae]|uniref:Helix-turn-helix transcriptional regulator n=1 Tax=Arsenophonus nasoniae TaxID=638 RepID=A0AA95GRV6_9GAMM|nr:helix-turn-helix transcriptional regulator [Arsenophonus nasoniae]WGM02876.1 helix-turn-helix transcriptional regulator [Arsenophonus nasoniae]